MKHIKIAAKQAPALVQGCMRIDAMSMEEVETLIRQDLELGINFLTMRIFMAEVCVRKYLERY